VPADGILADVEREGSTLLIAFGGLYGKFAGMPVFEFFSLLAREDPAVKRVFVRDLRQAWYQHGVEGAGASVPEVAARLREIAATSGAERVVTIGASAGGFGAILFGALIEADAVHAFSPQTFVDRRHRALYLDRTNRPQIAALRASLGARGSYFDLRRVVARADGSTGYVIHYPARNRTDVLHALRMRSLPGVELRPYPTRAHNVIGMLRDEGRLPALLETVISG
jgi:hypothetical protein